MCAEIIPLQHTMWIYYSNPFKAPLHILSPVTIYAGIHGNIVALKYILSPVWNSHFAHFFVDDNTYQSLPQILSPNIVKRIFRDHLGRNMIVSVYTERERGMYFKLNSHVWIFIRDCKSIQVLDYRRSSNNYFLIWTLALLYSGSVLFSFNRWDI